jgi:hypothetical protein
MADILQSSGTHWAFHTPVISETVPVPGVGRAFKVWHLDAVMKVPVILVLRVDYDPA